MFSNKMLYIPDFVLHMDVNTIINYFEKFEIAKVKNIEICEHPEAEYHVQGRYLYYFAIIEIDYYYDNNCARNFYKAIENNKCKMVYNDPYYWDLEFSPYHNLTSTIETETQTEKEKEKEPESENNNNVIVKKKENLIENLNELLNERLNEYLYNSYEDESDNDNNNEVEKSIEDNFVGYDFSCYNKFDNDLKNKLNARKRKFDRDLTTLKKTIDNIKEKHEMLQTLLIHKSSWLSNIVT